MIADGISLGIIFNKQLNICHLRNFSIGLQLAHNWLMMDLRPAAVVRQWGGWKLIKGEPVRPLCHPCREEIV